MPHWERHPNGDELLHLLEGEAEVVTLTDAGPVRSPLRAGSIFICPQGLWHQVRPRSPVSLFFATPGEGTEAMTTHPLRKSSRRGRVRKPELEARDIRATLDALPELRIGAGTTAAEADAAFGELASLNGRGLFVGRFHGLSPWERHSNGDELLHVLEGEVEETVLTEEGAVERTLSAGSVFVCPRGLWHRQLARRGATGLYATPKPTDVSFAEDPRLGG
jgi:quercetin dioxygenase-like cupin family protein